MAAAAAETAAGGAPSSSAAASGTFLPEGILSIRVSDMHSDVDGVDYQVELKTLLPCFRQKDCTVRRTQWEFSWLCIQMNVKSFAVPFGEGADPDGDMRDLQSLLLRLASDPEQQHNPCLRCFLTSPVPISSYLTSEALQAEERLLKDCTEDQLEDKSMEELRGLCLRHGLSVIANYDDRDYFLEKILMNSEKQLQSDLDVLEGAMKSIQGGWMDVDPTLTQQAAANLSLPEIEEALSALQMTTADDFGLQAMNEALPEIPPAPQAPLQQLELPEELLRALENPLAASAAEATANLENANN